MAVFPITTGLLTATDWRKSIISAGGFFDFTDGALQCVMLIDDFVSVQVIRRTAVEFFETTVDTAFRADARLKLIVNGSYGDNQTLKVLLRLAQPGTGPLEANLQDVMGSVIQGGAVVAGTPRPLRAFFAFDHTRRNQAPVCFYGIGDPPAGVDAALGGLGPLIIGNTKSDNRDAWYAALNSFPAQTGRIGIASSIATGLILVFAQPQGTKSGLTIDQLRDKLSDAGFDDAVLLDGSDSVMVTRDGIRQISQGSKKNRLTSIGLGFFYEAGSGLPTV